MLGMLSILFPGLPTQGQENCTTKSCVFCDVSAEKEFEIVYEDDTFVAFKDIYPACAQHYLVIPKKHIASVRTLQPSHDDVNLLHALERIGHTVLGKFNVPPEQRKMGFHIPPLNSINHLHLHVQGLPYRSRLQAAKYLIAPGFLYYSKGFSSFVEIHQAIRILENGKQIGIAPS